VYKGNKKNPTSQWTNCKTSKLKAPVVNHLRNLGVNGEGDEGVEIYPV